MKTIQLIAIILVVIEVAFLTILTFLYMSTEYVHDDKAKDLIRNVAKIMVKLMMMIASIGMLVLFAAIITFILTNII